MLKLSSELEKYVYYREENPDLIILHADCLEIIDLLPEVNLIVTDPPYEFVSKNPVGGGFMSKENKRHFESISDSFGMTYNPTKFLEMIKAKMKVFNLYVWTNKNLLLEYLQFAKSYKWDILNWIKPNPTPTQNGHYLTDKEYCVYIKKSGATFNSKLGYDKYFTAFKYAIGTKETKHPTEKPIEFIKNMIAISSNANDLIFDPYMGSGTTLLASKQLGRSSIGIEINKDFCEMAKQRIQNKTEQTSLI